MEIFLAVLAIHNTLSKTSYAMLALDSIKSALDSKGFDEAKTPLVDFICDRRFQPYFTDLCAEIELNEYCNSADYEHKLKHYFELEPECAVIVHLAKSAKSDIAVIRENFK